MHMAALSAVLADVFAYLLKALSCQGIFVVAWVDVAFARILFARSDVAAFGGEPTWNAVGLTAWFGATASGLALMLAGGVNACLAATGQAYLLLAHMHHDSPGLDTWYQPSVQVEGG